MVKNGVVRAWNILQYVVSGTTRRAHVYDEGDVMIFDEEELDELRMGYDWDGKYRVISNKIDGNDSRWAITYELTFELCETGKFYRVYYDVGATEMQEDTDTWGWARAQDGIRCDEVRRVEKVVVVYE